MNHSNAKKPSKSIKKDDLETEWRFVALFMLIVFASYSMRCWYRWARPDEQFLTFSASVVQIISIVSLLGLQTEWGKSLLGNHYPSPRNLSLIFAWLALASLLTFSIIIPLWANQKDKQGNRYYDQGQYSLAASAFQQAASMAPENARIHYNLGNAYESLNNFDQAIHEYQQALALDDSQFAAYNNLGRLYLSALDDPNAALQLGYTGLQKDPSPIAQAALLKNIGWAWLEKEELVLATNALTQTLGLLEAGYNTNAVEVDAHLPETYRLLALTYTKNPCLGDVKQAWYQSQQTAQNAYDRCSEQGLLSTWSCINTHILLQEVEQKLRLIKSETYACQN